MAKVSIRYEWEDAGFGAILQSPELAGVCEAAAADIAAKAGDGFKAYPWTSHAIGKSKYDRVAAITSSYNEEGDKAEATNKSLSKAVSRCRK